MIGKDADADPRFDIERYAVADELAPHGLAEPSSKIGGVFLVAPLGDDQKLTANRARHLIARARETRKTPRHLPQYCIAYVLAEGGANPIDIDQVEQQQRNALGTAVSLGARVHHPYGPMVRRSAGRWKAQFFARGNRHIPPTFALFIHHSGGFRKNG